MTQPPSQQEITALLVAWSNGERSALDQLTPLVYKDLREMAHNYLRRERAGHTLQTSDLVHEAYLKLINEREMNWQNRAHFFAVSAQMMRMILVDYARKRNYAKRGGGALRVSFDEALAVSNERTADLIALDDALNALAAFDERKSRIAELRYFGGLSVEETAEALSVAPVTVMRDWRLAKAWLYRELSQGDDDDA
jgi:RNA polymerase sigma-70 factor, ECF subfamily